MIRIWIGLVVLPVLALDAQAPRFRWALRDDPDLPADVRRTIDSMRVSSDRAHRCPPRADTLWAANPRAAIPTYWLEASVRPGCWSVALPNAVRRRLRDDSTSLRFYERVVRLGSGASETGRSAALLNLIWSAEPRYYPLLISLAAEQRPGLTPDSTNYNVSYNAIVALAPYLSDSLDARRLVERAAEDRSSKHSREAVLLALATANSDWSRQLLRRLPLAGVDEYIRGRVGRALAHTPCPRGLVFVEWFGVEGQDYSKCELPPDYR